MASIPSPDVNNRRIFGFQTQENGYLRVANLALVLVASGALLAAGFIARELHKADQALANFQPVYVRIDSLGKAEPVYFRATSYQPQAPEVINALTTFTQGYFTRMQGRIDDYWHAKFMLSEALMQSTYQDDQKTKWIEQVQRGTGIQNDVTVDKVALTSLSNQGGTAYVEFTKRFYESGSLTGKTESDTATYQFTFTHEIKGKMLQYNPTGLVLTNFYTNENLH